MNSGPKLNSVDLKEVFGGLQRQMIEKMEADRRTIPHAPTLGDEGESSWLALLQDYLPKRYQAEKAFVLDAEGKCSQQQDIVIFDRQYSPFLLCHKHARYIPAESVYAVFEVKQDLTKDHVNYAGVKAASVRALRRTTSVIYHAGGRHDPKPHFAVLAGLLCLESGWSPSFGEPFNDAIASLAESERLQCGCCLNAGAFECDWATPIPAISVSPRDTALVYFFLRLLAQLQKLGTVPAIDLDAYAKNLL
jgi:Domain of unknown function (DUF6602)